MRNTIILLLTIILTVAGWYLLIKPNDFDVKINAQTSKGTVYKSIKGWTTSLNKGQTTKTKILEEIPFSKLTNEYIYENHKLQMEWEIKTVNDTLTKVYIGINDLDNSITTRIKKLFGSSPLEKLIEREFSGFNTVLIEHIKQFKVDIIGLDHTKESYIAYINISCKQHKKADNMIMNSTYLNSFLQENDIKVISNPFLEIMTWNKKTGDINFNFCFPINERKDLPTHKEIKYKKVSSMKALKANFYGNYTYTDEAWFMLAETLEKMLLNPKEKIIEIFFENPHTTVLKDIEWKAEVFMEVDE